MRNDVYLAGLRAELERADDVRRSQIQAEITRVEKLPVEPPPSTDRPTPQDIVAARAAAYLAGLRAELERAKREPGNNERRIADIEAEIARIEHVPSSRRGQAERVIETATEKVKAQRAVSRSASDDS